MVDRTGGALHCRLQPTGAELAWRAPLTRLAAIALHPRAAGAAEDRGSVATETELSFSAHVACARGAVAGSAPRTTPRRRDCALDELAGRLSVAVVVHKTNSRARGLPARHGPAVVGSGGGVQTQRTHAGGAARGCQSQRSRCGGCHRKVPATAEGAKRRSENARPFDRRMVQSGALLRVARRRTAPRHWAAQRGTAASCHRRLSVSMPQLPGWCGCRPQRQPHQRCETCGAPRPPATVPCLPSCLQAATTC